MTTEDAPQPPTNATPAPTPPPAEPTPAAPPPDVRDGAIHFPLQANERVIQVCRRHWMYLWPRTALWLVFALAPVIIAAWLLDWAGQFDGTPLKIWGIASILWLIYWAVRILLNWYRYHNDIWVITNQRLIDSTKTSPFRLRVSTADLINVQDMTVEREGIFQTMLDYGDVVCQTAADVQEFRVTGVPDPRSVQLLVDKERDRERQRRSS